MTVIQDIGFGIADKIMEDYSRNRWAWQYQFFNQLLDVKKVYDVNSIIRSANRTGDILEIELKDRIKLRCPKDRSGSADTFLTKHFIPGKLKHINDLYHFSGFFSALHEIIIDNVYEKYYRIAKGDTVVDVGANIGIFTVKAAKAVGNLGKVIAIEPEKENLQMLNTNLAINDISNVTVVRQGVWSSKTELKLNISPAMDGHSFFQDEFYGTKKGSEFQSVAVNSLDNMLNELKIDNPGLIKMDIEGSEVEALKGMTRSLTAGTRLAVAAYHPINGERSVKTVSRYLREQGTYTLYRSIEGMVYADQKNR